MIDNLFVNNLIRSWICMFDDYTGNGKGREFGQRVLNILARWAENQSWNASMLIALNCIGNRSITQ